MPPYYLNTVNEGLAYVGVGFVEEGESGDGYFIDLKWNIAYPTDTTNKIAYHIFYSTDQYTVFDEGVKYISWNGCLRARLPNFTPGQLYHFAVRAVEYDPTVVNPAQLPQIADGIAIYPTSVLTQDITYDATVIPLLCTEDFPPSGILQVGVEFINYLVNDLANNELLLTNAALQRGFDNTTDRFHDTNGYDGYFYWSPIVHFVLGREEINSIVFPTQDRFEFPHYAYTNYDGYRQDHLTDILTTNLEASDRYNVDFAAYDYAGWRRTDPVELLNGTCVGSYIGGQQFFSDGYDGVGRMLRGLNFQQRMDQREEYLLSLTGDPVCLVRRVWSGITCPCVLASSEYPDDRCPICYGCRIQPSYERYYDPRRSDGRIMIRWSPTDDDLKMYEPGLESEFTADIWTLTVPTIKDRDFIVTFDQDDNEEFRYEVLYVNRNKSLLRLQGMQKARVQRVRKTDVIYQVPIFLNTQYFPTKLATGPASMVGIPEHCHTFQWSENGLGHAKQLSGISFGHSHTITIGHDGLPIVHNALSHTHSITIPDIKYPPHVYVNSPSFPRR